ncbi:MAG: GFA family protein [Steroidobacteraceae bacterium]
MIKNVGGTVINEHHRATCHCGAVELELFLPDGIVDASRCNCSLCRRKGAVMGYLPRSDLRIVRGAEFLSLYQFHTRVARHYFCSVCGIYTHHQCRGDPNQYGYNVGCLDGVNPLDLEGIELSDGANHPSDLGASAPRP